MATRQSLVDSAVKILLEEGDSELTTARLSREAGVVQSGFYAHFSSREACLAEAAQLIVDQLRVVTGAWRLEGMAQEKPGAADRSATRLHFARVLPLLAEKGRFVDLMVARRDERSPLGRRLRTMYQTIVNDVAQHLLATAQLHGVRLTTPFEADPFAAEVAALSELIVDSITVAARGYRRTKMLEPWLESITDITHASVTATIIRKLTLGGA